MTSLLWRQAMRPLGLLALISLLSLGVRLAWLGDPCRAPCRTAADHTLIFDETYYVNAARVIAGVRPAPQLPYWTVPNGDDGNSEHPQLAKLVVAGSIKLLGDGPWAWRVGSVLAGTIAILGMFALARAAGGSSGLAVTAAALMAADNLLLVHGRIATLDIYVVAAVVWGFTLYLRGRIWSAGAMIGLGSCMKLVGPYALIGMAFLEAIRARRDGAEIKERAWRLVRSVTAAAAVFMAGLSLLDRVAPPYDPGAKKIVAGVFGHLERIISYAAQQRSPNGPTGIASYPWQWLGDYKPITYLNINPSHPGDGLYHVHPAVHFVGLISPPILLLALAGLVLAARRVAARVDSPYDNAGELPLVGIAWFLGTFGPFELASLLVSRTSYLYYMVIVMPGLYLLAAWVLPRLRRPWIAAFAGAAVAVAAVITYPLTPLP